MSDLSKRFSLDFLVSANKATDYERGFQDCKNKIFEILIRRAKEKTKTDYIKTIFEDIGKL
jgi:hypothetical protein